MYSLLSCFSIALLFIDRDISLCVLDFKSGCRLNICCQKACVCVSHDNAGNRSSFV